MKTRFASEVNEGLFLFQPGQCDTSKAVLRKDVNDSCTQNHTHGLRSRSDVFVGLRARL